MNLNFLVNGMKKNIAFVSLMTSLIVCVTCGSLPVKNNGEKEKSREKEILKQYTESAKDRYAGYLVDLKKYTTRGGVFQEKYYKLIIAIARDITEKRGLSIIRGTVGFYYDKKANLRDRLYFGFDIDAGAVNNTRYGDVAVGLIKDNLKSIINTVNSARSMFNEKEIVGIVIGFSWKSPVMREQVNIWATEGDVIRFEDGRLTFDEVVQRSTITNTAGKIIRLR